MSQFRFSDIYRDTDPDIKEKNKKEETMNYLINNRDNRVPDSAKAVGYTRVDPRWSDNAGAGSTDLLAEPIHGRGAYRIVASLLKRNQLPGMPEAILPTHEVFFTLAVFKKIKMAKAAGDDPVAAAEAMMADVKNRKIEASRFVAMCDRYDRLIDLEIGASRALAARPDCSSRTYRRVIVNEIQDASETQFGNLAASQPSCESMMLISGNSAERRGQ